MNDSQFNKRDYVEFVEKLINEEKSKNIYFGIKQTSIIALIVLCFKELIDYRDVLIKEIAHVNLVISVVLSMYMISLLYKLYNLYFRRNFLNMLNNKKLTRLDIQYIKYNYFYEFCCTVVTLLLLIYILFKNKVVSVSLVPYVILFIYYLICVKSMISFIKFKIRQEKESVSESGRIVTSIIKRIIGSLIVYLSILSFIYAIYDLIKTIGISYILLYLSILIAIIFELINILIMNKSRNVIKTYLENLRNEIYILNLSNDEIRNRLDKNYLDRIEPEMMCYIRDCSKYEDKLVTKINEIVKTKYL